jgi:enoyl-CoA hydratase/carnithine racemase
MGTILTKVENKVAYLSIDRPEALNALSREIVDEIDAFVSLLERDHDVRVLVIRSEKNFAAGADIKDMADCSERQASAFSFSPTFNKLARLAIPTIAAIDGFALGGGMELALACDFRIASEKAKMGFPEINLGIMPGAGGTIRAARAAGTSAAMELILTGKIIKADRALELGLVGRVVPAEKLAEEAEALANDLAEKAPVALRTAKRTILMGAEIADEEEAVALESKNWAALFCTADQKEGMKAFLEKRKANFIGA